jgi:hypothetical protein
MLPPSRSAVWAGLLAVGLWYEFREIKAGDEGAPLTRVLRWVFHTDTAAGRIVFAAAVDHGSRLLVRHILEPLPSGTEPVMRNLCGTTADMMQHDATS